MFEATRGKYLSKDGQSAALNNAENQEHLVELHDSSSASWRWYLICAVPLLSMWWMQLFSGNG
jgi:hypothetical protein